MRHWVVTCILVAATATAATPSRSDQSPDRVAAILRTTPLIDGHNDLPWAIRESGLTLTDALEPKSPPAMPQFHTDLDRMRAGGIGAQFWSVYIPSTISGPAATKMVMEQIDLVRRMVKAHPNELQLARTAAEIRAIHRSGRIASLIGIEGGHAIDDSLALLREFHAAGARYMTLTHNHNTAWSGSATDAPTASGLTPFGEAVVREMNRLGMMVDLSLSSRLSRIAAMRISQAPVIFSHANAFALVPQPQNVDDEMLRMLKADGGLVMVTFVERFVSPEALEWRAGREAEEARRKVLHAGDPEAAKRQVDRWIAANPPPRATLAQVADHIDHVRRIAGVDHVGIGADFDGTPTLPLGLGGVETYPFLLAELMRRGWTDADIRKLAGENLLRVMRENERVAERLTTEGSAQ